MEMPVPVTARLSKAFYDRVGEQAANELVEWFNAVDAAYRADLRNLNELNFARFDARLEQRVAELGARIDQLGSRLDARIDHLEERMEERFASVGGRMDDFRSELLSVLRAGLSEQGAALERRLGEQARFMYLAWATMLAAIVGLGLR